MAPVKDLIGTQSVIPVLAFQEVAPTLRIIERMLQAGLRVIELTRRSDVARECLRQAKSSFGTDAVIGMGTILTPTQLDESIEDGADFGVSPGLTPSLRDALAASPLPFLPGCGTVSEAMSARDAGFEMIKMFPAEQIGGPAAARAIGAVLPDLGLCPTGGVTAENAPDYLSLPNIVCVGSSALTKPAGADDFDADQFAALVAAYRKPTCH